MLTKKKCCCGVPCSPCNIPKKDLTLSVKYTNSAWDYSLTLTYTGVGWTVGTCLGTFSTDTWRFSCAGGIIVLGWWCIAFTPCCASSGIDVEVCGSDLPSPNNIVLSDYTCSPFHLHYAGSPCLLTQAFITDVYIDE